MLFCVREANHPVLRTRLFVFEHVCMYTSTAPRLGFLLYDRVRVGEGVKNSAAGKGVLGPRSLLY